MPRTSTPQQRGMKFDLLYRFMEKTKRRKEGFMLMLSHCTCSRERRQRLRSLPQTYRSPPLRIRIQTSNIHTEQAWGRSEYSFPYILPGLLPGIPRLEFFSCYQFCIIIIIFSFLFNLNYYNWIFLWRIIPRKSKAQKSIFRHTSLKNKNKDKRFKTTWASSHIRTRKHFSK